MAYIKEVLTQLKARQPWEKVSASSGKSSIPKALAMFFEFARPRVSDSWCL
jgi:hypothetical protein